jgi:predicted nucleotidyltransferase
VRRAGVRDRLHIHHASIRAFDVSSLNLFGSVARDEARPDSGVEILVEFERPVGYFTLVRLGAFLEHRVDVVTPGALTDRLREEIRREAVRAA